MAVGPGVTALARTPWGPYSRATVSMRLITPAFAAAYPPSPYWPPMPAPEDI